MNLTQFLEEVDAQTAGMKPSEMQAFIHESARSLSAETREAFLTSLKSFSVPNAPTREKRDQAARRELIDEAKNLKDALEEIDDGRYVIHEEYNEEYRKT